MFISPITALEKGWVTHPQCTTIEDFKTRNFVSPNALDFTLDKLFTIEESREFVISETTKQMRKGEELFAKAEPESMTQRFEGEFWRLLTNTVYDGMSDFYVRVPEGVAAMLIIRSTFNRNGIFLTSGIYDAGFEGNIGFAVHNRSGIARIAPGTRIGQLIFVASDSVGQYAGGYNTKPGEHWAGTAYDTGITAKIKSK
jgi:deoxycytidine triphosphate deaminase